MDTPLALTGGTGALGSRVARMLAERSVDHRLIVRDPSKIMPSPGQSVVIGDYQDVGGLTTALSGVKTLFFVSGHEGPERMFLHRNVIRAATEAGVDRVVYTSFMGASPRSTFTFAREHMLTERAIDHAGMRLTSLRNSLYADVVPHFVGEDGVIRGPAGKGRIAWVAREDVARLAVEVLLDDVHAGQVYDVSGPEAIDLHETARLLSEATGREIRYHPETDQEARASRAGAAAWQVDGWVGSYAAIATGETSVTSHTIEHVTGIRPWSFAEFLSAEPGSWRHLVAK